MDRLAVATVIVVGIIVEFVLIVLRLTVVIAVRLTIVIAIRLTVAALALLRITVVIAIRLGVLVIIGQFGIDDQVGACWRFVVSVAELCVMMVTMMAFAVIGLVGAMLLFRCWLCLDRMGT